MIYLFVFDDSLTAIAITPASVFATAFALLKR